MHKQKDIFQQIKDHSYNIDNCFLCGCKLTSDNKTVEHVIPKWIQNRFKLWSQRLSLLNQTDIKYKHLTIPCCFNCNNKHLQPFETRISAAFNGGYQKFIGIDKNTLYLWLSKIYFGILYRELFLNKNIANPKGGTIINSDHINQYFSQFLFLQGIRNKHIFKEFFPASIFFFKTQIYSDWRKNWDFIDGNNLFIAIRMGEIGVIASLQDGGVLKELEDLSNTYKSISMHPTQFRELSIRILYKSLLINRTPKYINMEVNGVMETIMMPLQGMSNKPVFDDWITDDYVSLLSQFLGIPINDIPRDGDSVWTWLENENGEPVFIDVNNDTFSL